jgi:hypothetical protein
MEGVDGLGARDLDLEVVAAPGVEDCDRQAVRLRVPEQRYLETVAGADVQLACQLGRRPPGRRGGLLEEGGARSGGR